MSFDLTDEEVGDLMTATLNDLGRLRWNQIAQKVQKFEVFSRIMRKEKVGFDSGIGLQRTVQFDDGGAARNVGLYNTDIINVKDLLTKLNIPWKHATTNWAWDRRELLQNRNGAQIVNIVKPRRVGAILSLAKLLENNFWSKPNDTNDNLKPYGLLYWCVYNATLGFTGTNPSGFSLGAGNIDAVANPNWANYSGQYTQITKGDLIAKLRTMYRKMHFESPVSVEDFARGRGDQMRLYMNEPTIEGFEVLGESQNENLGNDLNRYADEMAFKKSPVIWVPQLDGLTTSNPVFAVNWEWFYPAFLEGEYLREGAPLQRSDQHNVWVINTDVSYNYLCTDRRQGCGVIAKSDPAAGI